MDIVLLFRAFTIGLMGGSTKGNGSTTKSMVKVSTIGRMETGTRVNIQRIKCTASARISFKTGLATKGTGGTTCHMDT